MKNDFTTAPLAPGLRGAGGGTVEKSFTASHTKIQTRPAGHNIRLLLKKLRLFCAQYGLALDALLTQILASQRHHSAA